MEGCVGNPLSPGRTVFCRTLRADLHACSTLHASCMPAKLTARHSCEMRILVSGERFYDDDSRVPIWDCVSPSQISWLQAITTRANRWKVLVRCSFRLLSFFFFSSLWDTPHTWTHLSDYG